MTDEERRKLEDQFNQVHYKEIVKIEERNFIRKKKMELKKLKKEYRVGVGLTTTKLLSFYLFAVFNIVLIYAMVAMWHFGDLSMLSVIISDIVGQIFVYGIYAVRAYKDTKSEELMKLEKKKLDSLPREALDKMGRIIDILESNTEEDENNSDE